MSELTLQKLTENIKKVIVGKDEVVELVLTALLCEGHLLLEDVPGTGKTTLVRTLSASIGGTFQRIQFTPDLLPSDVTGLSWFNQKNQTFEFKPGPLLSNFVLADEINRATPRTQSALLEAMQEKQVTVDRETYHLPKPFMVLATQNPIELEGTFPLPEAQLDRFLLKLSIGYPDQNQENTILERFYKNDPLLALEQVVDTEQILSLIQKRKNIRVEDSVRDYIVRIARATRINEDIQLGASPRASLALYIAAQAWSLIKGRDYVLPDDVKFMAHHVLNHRLIISPQAQLRGRNPHQLIIDIIAEVPVPVEG